MCNTENEEEDEEEEEEQQQQIQRKTSAPECPRKNPKFIVKPDGVRNYKTRLSARRLSNTKKSKARRR